MVIEDLVRRRLSELNDPRKPRLRFDKVAIRFLEAVRSCLRDAVPAGKTVVLTIAAPIRAASKTAEELEIGLRERLIRGAAESDLRYPIQGNDIRMRLVDSRKGAPKVVGFVHSPDAGAAKALFDMTQPLVELSP